jgi:uncharacterized small protein (DUF1192 family)
MDSVDTKITVINNTATKSDADKILDLLESKIATLMQNIEILKAAKSKDKKNKVAGNQPTTADHETKNH